MEHWKLPDEFLIHILSLLPPKEAAKTSILSTRWRYLWTHITRLNFDRMDVVKNMRNTYTEEEDILEVERIHYINWVNKICSLIQAPSIEVLRICFDLGEESKLNLDKWVKFAMEKKVKNLELVMDISPSKTTQYVLSCSVTVSSGIQHLESLNLKNINVSGELLEHFLLHCPSLEQISVPHSEHLTTLNVGLGVRLHKLKCLKIVDCSNLAELQISAPKLSYFQYEGRPIDLHIENVPLLSHLYIGGKYGDRLSCPVTISLGIKHLKSLNLKRVNISGELLEHFLLYCPSLEQISVEDSKHLMTLKVGVGVGVRLHKFTCLKIVDCFNLEELQICAPKLSYFHYEGPRINLHIENVPSLSHLYIGGKYGDCLTWLFSALSNYLCQIQTLVLRLQLDRTRIPKLLELSSLRELTVRVSPHEDGGFLYLLSLLKASPLLEKLRFESGMGNSQKLLEENDVLLCPHEHLKVLEFVGFLGKPNELIFIRHLARAAIRLEKLVIDPRPPWSVSQRDSWQIFSSRQSAERLRSEIPQWIEFVVL